MGKSNKLVQIGDAARQVGISVETLKRHATRGHLRVWRNSFGWRFFAAEDLRSLALRLRRYQPPSKAAWREVRR